MPRPDAPPEERRAPRSRARLPEDTTSSLRPLVRKTEVNRQMIRRVLRRQRPEPQRAIHERRLRLPIKQRATARRFDLDIGDRAVTLDGEHHDRRAVLRLYAAPDTTDAVDDVDKVRLTAEIGIDFELRAAATAADGESGADA